MSTGACIGHITPEALAGGPIGKVREGDLIQITIDRDRLTGRIDLVAGDDELARREPRADLKPDPGLPADTRVWALLQNASGGTWGGCVYDPDSIAKALARR